MYDACELQVKKTLIFAIGQKGTTLISKTLMNCTLTLEKHLRMRRLNLKPTLQLEQNKCQ